MVDLKRLTGLKALLLALFISQLEEINDGRYDERDQ
jgi:hypothetical protein